MITLITPTGGRPSQIKICNELMNRQTFKGPVTWIIIDDCMPSTIQKVDRKGWEVIKIYPSPVWQPGQNTQGRNINEGIKAIPENTEAIFIIEDDDYYRADYLDEMMLRAGGQLIWGEMNTIYYNVEARRWLENRNMKWSSLFQTAMKPAALKYMLKLLNEKFIDFELFRICPKPYLFTTKDKLSIGIKGQPGRDGIGNGHRVVLNMWPDKDMIKLKQLIGDDYRLYERCYSGIRSVY